MIEAQSNNNAGNRLISEKSPYLLQHARNPVDWYPWGHEAFEKAKYEDRPIFLSIGYSTCHWCHVMEKESFEDPDVARLLNETFVSIKVDREERPDIDSVYMSVCQAMTGSGGWPLSIIMTPDKKPFYAATYIPRESKFGRMGMLDLIPRIKDLWERQRDEIISTAGQTVLALNQLSMEGDDLNEDSLHDAYSQLFEMFDEEYGGFGGAPKFPAAHNLLFLLRYWKRTGDDMSLHMVKKTLTAMRMGGIYDHVGFGFHRYSTDTRWLVPHFEKMLYDQAMLALAYLEAYQVTEDEAYERTAREIFTYVLRDMTAQEGGFYCAEDADSEGREGKFYVWSEEEIRQVLEGREADLLIRVLNIEREGNYIEEATGRKIAKNILHLKRSIDRTATDLGIKAADLLKDLDSALLELFAAREKRIHPHKDDKILTDWNGLMIAALARGAKVLNEPVYAQAGKRSAEFILGRMCDEGRRLFHRYREGERAIPGFLDDYAFFVFGMIELYETNFDTRYLKVALELTDVMLEHFWDKEKGGFYFTADDSEEILIRKKVIYDGAVPSGNSLAMLNLLRLGRMTDNPEYQDKAARIGRFFSRSITHSPAGYTFLLSALDYALGPASEVIIVGNANEEDTKLMMQSLRKQFIPNTVVIFRPGSEELPEITGLAEYTKNLTSMEGKATAYVCQNYICQLPSTDAGEMLELLNKKN